MWIVAIDFILICIYTVSKVELFQNHILQIIQHPQILSKYIGP